MQDQALPEVEGGCVRMLVEQLSIGMFIAELDRPWAESPFLIEGFRIDTADELAAVTRLCRYVTVDTSRSAGADDTAADDTLGDGKGGTYAFTDPAVQAALDRNAAYTSGVGARVKKDPTREHGLHDQPLGWRWIGDIVHDLLQSYLRPRQPAVDDLPAPDIKPVARRTSADLTPPAEPGFLGRLIREVLARPTPPDAAVRQPARPRRDVPMHADNSVGPGREAGAWARFKTALRELTATGRTAEADTRGAYSFEELKQSSPQDPAAGAATRSWPPIGQLLKRALCKLLGLAPPAEAGNSGESATPADDLSAEERAASALEYERFTQEIPNAVRVLKQSMSALHLNYYRAGCEVPLALELLRPWVTEIVDSVLRSENALVWLARLESHDLNAHKRGLQAAVYMAQFGAHLGMPRDEIEKISLGGALLDIGKMQVAEDIIKKPGPLDADEQAQVRAHVDLAMSMMDASGINDVRVRETVERHHEREDGSGYPHGLAGEDIGVYGRIAGIVDTFLALTGERSYAPRAPMDTVLRLLLQARGTLFHAPLVEHFIQMIGVYPVGSLVELSTGEVAAVLSHNRVRRLRPRVLIMVASDGVPLPRPTALDLLYCPRDGAGNVISIVRGLPFGHQGISAEQLFTATVQ